MKKENELEIKKAPEELTEQDLEKVTGGSDCPSIDLDTVFEEAEKKKKSGSN